MTDSLGDAAQVRMIVEQVATAMNENSVPMDKIDQHIDARVTIEVRSAMSSMKVWVLGGIAANMLPIMFFAYQFGQYSNTIDSAIGMVREQQVVLAGRGQWMNTMEGRVGSLEQWAEPQGHRTPKQMEGIR